MNGVPAESRAGRDQSLRTPEGDKNLPRIRQLNEIAEKRGQTLAEMALAWVLRLPTVTSALIGASSVAQLETNLKALDNLEFSKKERSAIDKALR